MCETKKSILLLMDQTLLDSSHAGTVHQAIKMTKKNVICCKVFFYSLLLHTTLLQIYIYPPCITSPTYHIDKVHILRTLLLCLTKLPRFLFT